MESEIYKLVADQIGSKVDKFSEKDDFDKISSLLQEYSQKLQSLCEKQLDDGINLNISRIKISIIIALSILAFFLLLIFFINNNIFIVQRDVILLISLLGVSFVFISILLQLRMRASKLFAERYIYTADQIAFSLKRLIKAASQYSEHASNKLGYKFEFDLRLAEAEAVLMLYERVFNKVIK